MSDVGWCLACRSILYTDFQIAKSDFRQTEFKTMVFPVRDVIWLQERVRLRDAEISAMDTTNDEMGVTIGTLRDDLAEARADVRRLEAQLDAARAEAKRLQDLIERRRIADTDRVCYVCERPMRSDQAVTDQDIDNICPACASETIGTLNHASRTLRAGAEQADARYRAELAQARAERDKAMKQRDFAKDGEDNMRFLKVLWENECGFYRAQSVARLHEIDMGRRTIRALVVACRAIHRTLWQALDQYEVNDRGIVRDMRQHVIGLNIEQAKQSGQQAGE